MRLDKLIESKLHTTRKEMKRLFLMNKVRIDGEIERNPSRNIDSSLHKIMVNDTYLTTNEVYYLMNKPNGVVTAVTDAKCQTVVELLSDVENQQHVYPVGRLDRDTTGLLLLTSNGQLGYELLLPNRKVTKTYEAKINARVTEKDVESFEKVITFADGTKCKPAKLVILSSGEDESFIRLTIQEGKFHQVKKMFLACGKKVIALKRVAMGPLHLDGKLLPGQYRTLYLEELELLRPYFK